MRNYKQLIIAENLNHRRSYPCGVYDASVEGHPNVVIYDAENVTWWRHQMGTFSALLAFCAGNSPVTAELPTQRPVTRSFDVFFHMRLNRQLSKQWRRWWFDTPPRSLWRQCNKKNLALMYWITFAEITIYLHCLSIISPHWEDVGDINHSSW